MTIDEMKWVERKPGELFWIPGDYEGDWLLTRMPAPGSRESESNIVPAKWRPGDVIPRHPRARILHS